MLLDKTTKFLGSLILLLFGLVFVLYATVARNSFYRPGYGERKLAGAAWKTKGITVAAVWPEHEDMTFVHGVQLAMEEANTSK